MGAEPGRSPAPQGSNTDGLHPRQSASTGEAAAADLDSDYGKQSGALKNEAMAANSSTASPPPQERAPDDEGEASRLQDADSGPPENSGRSRPLAADGNERGTPTQDSVEADRPKPWRAQDEPDKAGTGHSMVLPTTSKPWRPSEPVGDTAEKVAKEQAARNETEASRRQPGTAGSQPVRLFRTAAFRGNFNALPKWKRVLSKATAQVRELNACTQGKNCPPGAASWQRIISQAKGLAPMEKLKTVNTFFNKWPYRLDQDIYGTSDWWATPQEFLKLSGDCEDYAITKYYALRELGFSSDDLRIVVLQDRIRGIAHAILTVFLDGDAYVLDNVTSVVFSHSKYAHYVPYYSLNEQYRWSHIPVDKKP